MWGGGWVVLMAAIVLISSDLLPASAQVKDPAVSGTCSSAQKGELIEIACNFLPRPTGSSLVQDAATLGSIRYAV